MLYDVFYLQVPREYEIFSGKRRTNLHEGLRPAPTRRITLHISTGKPSSLSSCTPDYDAQYSLALQRGVQRSAQLDFKSLLLRLLCDLDLTTCAGEFASSASDGVNFLSTRSLNGD